MKKTIKSNYSLKIKPVRVRGRAYTPEEELNACNAIAMLMDLLPTSIDVKVSIEHDLKEVCSYCEAPWEPSFQLYPKPKGMKPTCCKEALSDSTDPYLQTK